MRGHLLDLQAEHSYRADRLSRSQTERLSVRGTRVNRLPEGARARKGRGDQGRARTTWYLQCQPNRPLGALIVRCGACLASRASKESFDLRDDSIDRFPRGCEMREREANDFDEIVGRSQRVQLQVEHKWCARIRATDDER